MAIFSELKKKDELVLVFDIGSSSVGGALFLMRESGIPKIIFSVREPVVFESKVSADRCLFLTIRSLRIVADKISTAGVGAPSKIFCVLSSLWYAHQTRTIKYSKDIPFVFTTTLAESLTEKEVTLFEEEYKAKYLGTDEKVRPIEFRNMKTILNGYETSKPLNQKAKELEMSIFISTSSEHVLEKIEETIFRYFHSKDVKFASFIMTSFSVVRDMFVNQESFFLVDIGGEITDISMIKKDILHESISFPLGRNFLIRGIAESLNCSLDDARSLISLYKDGHAEASTERKLDPAIAKLKTEWLQKFQESLAAISNDISIPATIFVTVDQDFTDFFTEIIKTEQFNQYTLTESKFRVIFLGTEALHGIAVFEEDITRDPFLIIESIYINRFLR